MRFATMRPPPQGAEAVEMARRKLRMWRRWNWVERCFRAYVFVWNPSELFPYFREREGQWVLLRLIILGGCTIATALDCGTVLAMPLAFLLAADILLFNIAVVFVTALPLSLLRSNIFTMTGYVSLALAFSPFWLLLPCFPGTKRTGLLAAGGRSLDAFYQSARTLTTAGTDIPDLCRWGKALASIEGLIGIYFLSIIIAGYLSLPKGGRTA
jgi:hypothetical protein